MEKFDVVIVGAGLAGLTAAYTLAKDGAGVLVLERGDYPGAKNMTGGRIYMNTVRAVMPNFWDSAPFERHVSKEIITFMKEKTAVNMELVADKLNQPPYHSYTVLRAKFDQWLGNKAEEAGAMIVTKNPAEDLIRKDGKVIGVKSGEDEVGADVVIIAEGANSLLTEKAGMRKKSLPRNYAVGIKELIELPKSVIEDRFQLNGDEGAAQLFVGSVTRGVRGGGFLYTNTNSVSLGIVVGMEAAMETKLKNYELTEDFKAHPAIKNIIKGGKVLEYSAHIIPEGGLGGLSAMYGDGVLATGDAAGLCLNLGIAVKGMDYAIISGQLAANAVKYAREKKDFSAQTLSYYQALLDESVVMRDFMTFKNAPSFLESDRIYDYYPNLVCNLLESVLYFDGGPKMRFTETALAEFKKDYPSLLDLFKLLGVLKDAYGGLKAL